MVDMLDSIEDKINKVVIVDLFHKEKLRAEIANWSEHTNDKQT
jgi:hypothetical protein